MPQQSKNTMGGFAFVIVLGAAGFMLWKIIAGLMAGSGGGC